MKPSKAMESVRDPHLISQRIYIGNLPPSTRAAIESICKPYGVPTIMMHAKKFAFVQFDSEEAARKASAALNGSTFKGVVINSSMAKAKPPASGKAASDTSFNGDNNSTLPNVNSTVPQFPLLSMVGNMNSNDSPPTDTINDCEIIVIDRKNTKYAEYIEDRLKKLGLRVDVLFPNADVSLGQVLSSISSRGVYYAVLVTNQHEEHQSITVNILYGHPAEHRNMPLEDAINLLSEDFKKKRLNDGNVSQIQPVTQLAKLIGNVNMNKAVPIISAAQALGQSPSLNDRHPEAIQMLFNLLAGNMPLTALQYDRIIKYLMERKELQVKAELGDCAPPKDLMPDPEIEMQRKLKDIMNKPSVAENSHRMYYENLTAVKEDVQIMNLLKDIKIQNALDMLLNNSNLVASIESAMKF